jgi:hypothetical protein
MTTIVLVLVLLIAALGFGESVQKLRRRRARDRRIQLAVREPEGRGAAIDELRRESQALKESRGPSAQLFGRRGVELERGEIGLGIALLLLVEDRPEEALEELAAIDPNRLPRHLQGALSLHAVEAHLRLSEWDAAERVLDGYSADALNENGRALRSNARARICLGRGEARSALRVLDEILPVPAEVKDEIEKTRAQARRALDGESPDPEPAA